MRKGKDMKKVTYLGNDIVAFVWEDISELSTEARKYNINIKPNCTIGSNCTIKPNCTIGSNCTIEPDCTIESNCTIEPDCTIESGCTIGYDCTIKHNCTIKSGCKVGYKCAIGSNCKVGYDCTIGSGCKIGYDCTIEPDCTIGYNCAIESDVAVSMFIGKLYRYCVFVRIEKEKTFIKLGCFDRTIEDWDADFYNNDREFPRGSNSLKLREEAYATARTIALELRKNLIK